MEKGCLKPNPQMTSMKVSFSICANLRHLRMNFLSTDFADLRRLKKQGLWAGLKKRLWIKNGNAW